MLTPIPGTTHLHVVDLEASFPAAKPQLKSAGEFEVNAELTRLATVLIQVAAEVAFGVRPLSHLNKRRFGFAVRAYAQSCQRKTGLSGPVTIHSVHVVEGPYEAEEIYGSLSCKGKGLAYCARLNRAQPRQLTNFRVV